MSQNTLLFHEYYHQWMKLYKEGAQPKINKTDFKLIDSQLPNLEEQIQIGQFFETLDNMIDVNQDQSLTLTMFSICTFTL